MKKQAEEQANGGKQTIVDPANGGKQPIENLGAAE